MHMHTRTHAHTHTYTHTHTHTHAHTHTHTYIHTHTHIHRHTHNVCSDYYCRGIYTTASLTRLTICLENTHFYTLLTI